MISAIIGHHLKANRDDFGVMTDRSRLLVYPEGIREVVEIAGEAVGIRPSRSITIEHHWTKDRTNGLFDELEKNLQRFHRSLRTDTNRSRLMMAVRSALIITDSAGSGLARERMDTQDWLRASFSQDDVLGARDIEREVIRPRIDEIKANSGSFEWTDFQVVAEGFPDRALLLASCGSGKTLAAWRWIRGQLARRSATRDTGR